MGFVRERKIFLLEFADDQYKGLEIRVSSPDIGTLRPLLTAGTNISMEEFDELLELFIKSLVGWNLEDKLEDGTLVPVPADRAGVLSCTPDFLTPVFEVWASTMAGVPGPLDRTSTSGDGSLVASLPMEPLSASLAS